MGAVVTGVQTCALPILLDTTAKCLVQSYPLGQVVWARYVGHVVLAAALLLPLHGRGLLVTQRPGLQVLRSLFLFGSTCANFAALQYLQLAETSSILFSKIGRAHV